MEVSFAPSFLKLLSKLDPQAKESVKQAVGRVIDSYYSLDGDELRFTLAGDHDEVRNFLRQL